MQALLLPDCEGASVLEGACDINVSIALTPSTSLAGDGRARQTVCLFLHNKPCLTGRIHALTAERCRRARLRAAQRSFGRACRRVAVLFPGHAPWFHMPLEQSTCTLVTCRQSTCTLVTCQQRFHESVVAKFDQLSQWWSARSRVCGSSTHVFRVPRETA